MTSADEVYSVQAVNATGNSVASSAAAQLLITPASFGKNLLNNPSFEGNVVGTPYYPTDIAVGAPISDGWYVSVYFTVRDPRCYLDPHGVLAS